jgi:hypothetical protein
VVRVAREQVNVGNNVPQSIRRAAKLKTSLRLQLFQPARQLSMLSLETRLKWLTFSVTRVNR